MDFTKAGIQAFVNKVGPAIDYATQLVAQGYTPDAAAAAASVKYGVNLKVDTGSTLGKIAAAGALAIPVVGAAVSNTITKVNTPKPLTQQTAQAIVAQQAIDAITKQQAADKAKLQANIATLKTFAKSPVVLVVGIGLIILAIAELN